MAGEMSHYMKDLYPNMGFQNTTYQTIPEAEDQQALVDDQKIAEETGKMENKAGHKNIMLGIVLILIIMFVLGKV
ncbi:hypothetical protein PDR34_27430 [Bacillus cereus]|uniref:hypothetical protein n=1 Tax=Bacillus cereus group sp. Bc015 TaxID=3018123 RepID=UPI0022E8A758|nr:hypothetical protein [Bacillus cereus group sp. Bc015]MDA2733461.1 hypothetical protein [Bacillus cereus]MDA2738824.1 hypothetical protein [Bacillus cereus group sp. Bc015]